MYTPAETSFNEIPWQPPTPSTPAWHKRSVPIHPHSSNLLQTLDVWLPTTSFTTTPPPSFPNLPGTWLIFIHGGAWRDPAVTSMNFATPTIRHLLSKSADDVQRIAGIISLSYSLSPKTSVPSASPEEAKSREALHPQHILDVVAGLRFAEAVFGSGVQRRGIVVGHSCGATLALQTVMRSGKAWASAESSGGLVFESMEDVEEVWQPAGMVLLCGIYDVPLLCATTTPEFVPYVPIYKELVLGAFGDDEDVWRRASPVFHEDFAETWKGESLVVLADSAADGMVPPEQGEEMMKVLLRQGWKEVGGEKVKGRAVSRVALKGGHDALWEDGGQIAKVVVDVLKQVQ